VICDQIPWACLAPEVQLDHLEGRFFVSLTPTDSDPVPWYYVIETPAGAYRLAVPYRAKAWTLKELIVVNRLGPRAPH